MEAINPSNYTYNTDSCPKGFEMSIAVSVTFDKAFTEAMGQNLLADAIQRKIALKLRAMDKEDPGKWSIVRRERKVAYDVSALFGAGVKVPITNDQALDQVAAAVKNGTMSLADAARKLGFPEGALPVETVPAIQSTDNDA